MGVIWGDGVAGSYRPADGDGIGNWLERLIRAALHRLLARGTEA